jgi:dynein heavy chain, axonemal
MNPNYAGRSKLPENLKSLFRTCAMMMPDYNMIAEIYLFSVGFHYARDLSRKMVSSLHLCSQQLSVQEHYDFGMRALKTILVAAGEIKRKEGDNEEAIIMKAIVEINLPKFNSEDVPLFNNIISDLFQMEASLERKEELETKLGNAAESLNLVDERNIIEKCVQVFNTLSVRHGIMLIGSAFTGIIKINTKGLDHFF